jgi:hypothetical protein
VQWELYFRFFMGDILRVTIPTPAPSYVQCPLLPQVTYNAHSCLKLHTMPTPAPSYIQCPLLPKLRTMPTPAPSYIQCPFLPQVTYNAPSCPKLHTMPTPAPSYIQCPLLPQVTHNVMVTATCYLLSNCFCAGTCCRKSMLLSVIIYLAANSQ